MIDLPIKGVRQPRNEYHPESSGAILHLQREVGNAAVTTMLEAQLGPARAAQSGVVVQRALSEKDSAKLATEMAAWPHDAATLEASYPIAKEIRQFAEKHKKDLTHGNTRLAECMTLHTNRGRIRALIELHKGDHPEDWVAGIEQASGSIGVKEGTLFESDDAAVLAQMPDYALSFFGQFMDGIKQWSTLNSDEERLLFLDRVINQAKGYSWAVKDLDDWPNVLKTKRAGGATADVAATRWLSGSSNMNPFTMKNVHVDSIGELLKSEYSGYSEDLKKSVAETLYWKLVGSQVDAETLSDKATQTKLSNALQVYLSSSQADGMVKAVVEAAATNA